MQFEPVQCLNKTEKLSVKGFSGCGGKQEIIYED